VNAKRIHRLYREEGLGIRPRTPRRRRSCRHCSERPAVMVPNECWAMDFLPDQLFDGRPFRILAIIDVHTRESLAIVSRVSFRAFQVVEVLDRLAAERGRPRVIRVDNVLYREPAGRSGQQASVASLGRRWDTDQRTTRWPPPLRGALDHSEHRVRRRLVHRAAALTVLETRCKPGWRTRTLSTGSPRRPHGSDREGFLHLAPAPRRRAGSRHRS
jgi:hypothetical protein